MAAKKHKNYLVAVRGTKTDLDLLGAFNEETPDWLSFFMFTFFYRP